MAIMKGRLKLKKKAYLDFQKLWKEGKFGKNTFGKAFYDHFKLQRLDDQAQLLGIEGKDGDAARQTIDKVFVFN